MLLIFCAGYAYDNINPWRPRHDQVIRRILEAGLVETWKKRTWIRMKREYQEELKRTGKEGIKFDIKPLISAITLDDFQVNLTISLFIYLSNKESKVLEYISNVHFCTYQHKGCVLSWWFDAWVQFDCLSYGNNLVRVLQYFTREARW